MANGELTDRQQAFVKEYLIDLNATQAYIRAGYNVKDSKVAESKASRLVSNGKVSRAIEAEIAARSKRTEITADWVLTNLKEIAERCMQKKPVMVWDRSEKCMVQAEEDGEGVWTFDSTGANRATELAGKHLGMFTDKLNIGNADGTNLEPPKLVIIRESRRDPAGD